MKTILSVLMRRWMLGILAVLFALPVAFGPFRTQVTAAQSCLVRTDWPIYIVVRGDTLYKIAQRYGTTSGVLASANCLPNINVIYSGQQLRVPPSPVVLTPVPQPPNTVTYNVRISFQRFDNGFMFWRADNGEISVYVGQVNGTTTSYPSYTYGLLPENPVNEATPAGHIRPIFGIGKVWGNFYNVRANIGWATTPEVGYVTTVTRVGTSFNFILPDGRIVYVAGNRTWSTSGSPVPPTAIPPTPVPGPSVTSTAASYQPFEGGFMIWESRTGNIVTFYNNGTSVNASYTVYPASQYANLPDNPVLDPTPSGRVRPAFGIGKVWGNFFEVRNNLGWALTPEQGFLATFTSSSNSTQSQTCFVLPDGRPVTYIRLNTSVRYWLYSGACS
jgi:LysM repeat protein